MAGIRILWQSSDRRGVQVTEEAFSSWLFTSMSEDPRPFEHMTSDGKDLFIAEAVKAIPIESEVDYRYNKATNAWILDHDRRMRELWATLKDVQEKVAESETKLIRFGGKDWKRVDPSQVLPPDPLLIVRQDTPYRSAPFRNGSIAERWIIHPHDVSDRCSWCELLKPDRIRLWCELTRSKRCFGKQQWFFFGKKTCPERAHHHVSCRNCGRDWLEATVDET